MGQTIRVENFVSPGEGSSVGVQAGSVPVAVFRVGPHLYAIDATCPHAHGPLEQGRVSATTVECPWHGSIFSLESGNVLRGPATVPVRAYRARTDGTTLILESD